MAKNNVKIVKVPIELDKKRFLIYDLESFEYLEELYGDMTKIFSSFNGRSPKCVKQFLQAGLLHYGEELDFNEVKKFVNSNNMLELGHKIGFGMTASMPEVEKKEEEQEKN
jgi:hypothetical protein